MRVRGSVFKFASDVDAGEAAELGRRLVAAGATLSVSGHEPGCVLVFAALEGDEYTAARSRRKKIMGAPALAAVLEAERTTLPALETSPVFSLQMERMVLCGTGLAQTETDQVTKLVALMGGKFYNEFVPAVTHLLAHRPSTSSSKYQVALRKKRVPILSPKWVYDTWEQQEVLLCGPYRIAPFMKLRIAAADGALEESLRVEMQQMVEANGGEWVTGAVDRKTTHVIVKAGHDTTKLRVPQGCKMVPYMWVKECVRLGGLIDESDPELQKAFVAFVTSDCPPNAAQLVAQCQGVVTNDLDKATVLVSPVGLVADSPLLRNRNLPIVTPNWLLESCAAGTVLPTERFAPSKVNQPLLLALSNSNSNSSSVNHPTVGLFTGSSFSVLGFDEDAAVELTGLVLKCGGRLGSGTECFFVLNDGFAFACERKLSASWLRVAASLGIAPDTTHFASLPFSFPSPSVLMSGCVVSTTGFVDPERSLLQDCITRLGARYESRMRNNETTHLICKTPSGDKYEAVVKKKWNVHLVSLAWLRQCCKTGRPADASEYPVIGNAPGRVLQNVRIYFSSAIAPAEQRRLGDLAAGLGAELSQGWSLDVTHMVHTESSRKVRDLPSESELALVCVVSPAWLLECHQKQEHLDEDTFPASLNPRRNLGSSIVVAPPTPVLPVPLPSSAVSSSSKRSTSSKQQKQQQQQHSDVFTTPMVAQRKKARVEPDVFFKPPLPPQEPAGGEADEDELAAAAAAEATDKEEAAKAAAAAAEAEAAAQAEAAKGLELELDGLVGAIRSFGAVTSVLRRSSGGGGGGGGGDGGESKAGSLTRQASISSGSMPNAVRSGTTANNTTTTNGNGSSSGVLRRAELKGSSVAAVGGVGAGGGGGGGIGGGGVIGGGMGGGGGVGGNGPSLNNEYASDKDGGDDDNNDQEDRPTKAVTYVDKKQLRKQRQAVERSRKGASGKEDVAPAAPSSAKKRSKYLDSDEQQSSVELESESENKRRTDSRSGRLVATRQIHFTLSKYDEEQKRELSGIIAQLGGVCDDEFDPGVTTHVVVPVPSRSLKYLMGAASGVWVLQGEYLRECSRARTYVDEEPHEWTSRKLPPGAVQSTDKLELSDAPRKMRVLRERGDPPLLHHARCCFLGPADSIDTYTQLAAVLGAVVVYSGSKPNWTRIGTDLTHVFCSANYPMTSEDIAVLESNRISCHLAEWIVQAILRARLPKAVEFVPPKLGKNKK